MDITLEKILAGWDRLCSSVFTDPMFCLLTLASYILFVFSIVGVSGGWIDYNTHDRYNNTVLLKHGLFNDAANNIWMNAPHSKCIEVISLSQSTNQIKDRIMFCDARLACGILMMLSLFMVFACAVALTLILSSSLEQGTVLKIKPFVLGLFSLSGMMFFFSFCTGAGSMFRVIASDFPGAYYGVGFVAAVISWVLATSCAVGFWYMIDENGLIRAWNLFNRNPDTIPEISMTENYAGHREKNLPSVDHAGHRDKKLPSGGQSKLREKDLPSVDHAGYREKNMPSGGQSKLRENNFPSADRAGYRDKKLPSGGQSKLREKDLPSVDRAGHRDKKLPSIGQSKSFR